MAAIEDRARDVVVVGASAGGIQPLARLVSLLPADLPAALLVAVHATGASVLTKILARDARMVVQTAEDGDRIQTGHVYVAPKGRHLTVHPKVIRLVPAVRDGRPSEIDSLFRSAAEAYGSRVIAVVLSGALDDGTAGMRAVHQAGGLRFVQEPDEALHPWMPMNAIEGDEPQAVAPVDRIAVLIDRAAREPSGMTWQHDMAPVARMHTGHSIQEMERLAGPPTSLTCPECGGTLWEGPGGQTACHVGHRFSAEELAILQDLEVDAALWTAVRALEERAEIARRLGEQALSRGHDSSGRRFAERVRVARSQAAEVRRVARARSLAGHRDA